MVGEPLKSVELGVNQMLSSLRKNPYALETAFISVITFAAKAKVAQPLRELIEVRPPTLALRPGTCLGAALDLLAGSIKNDVVKTTDREKGDFRPLAFILTDGQPTDDWEKAAKKIKEIKPKLANIYAIGCGDEVNFQILAQIADSCVHVNELDQDSLSKLFVWLTASVQSSIASPDDPLSLEKIPLEKGMELVSPDRLPQLQTTNKRLFFHLKCRNTRKNYLMRYKLSPNSSIYQAEDAFPLPDDFFSDGALKAPPVDSSKFSGSVNCPYCGGPSWVMCSCGQLCCLDPPIQAGRQIVCPACERVLTLGIPGSGGDFSVGGSVG
jgi:uncharacterized protein YegL